jgi:hypothetical protein
MRYSDVPKLDAERLHPDNGVLLHLLIGVLKVKVPTGLNK